MLSEEQAARLIPAPPQEVARRIFTIRRSDAARLQAMVWAKGGGTLALLELDYRASRFITEGLLGEQLAEALADWIVDCLEIRD